MQARNLNFGIIDLRRVLGDLLLAARVSGAERAGVTYDLGMRHCAS